MHGDWWKRVHEVPSRWARAIAIALTVVGVVAVFLPVATSRLQFSAPRPAEMIRLPPEAVVVVSPPPAPRPPPEPTARTRRPSARVSSPAAGAPVGGVARPGPVSPPLDSTRHAPARASGRALPLAVGHAYEPLMPSATARVGPTLAQPLTGTAPPLTQIGADSARRALGEDVAREALTRKPPQSETDAALRERERQQKAQWDAHRPVALPVSGVRIPFPLFSPGPSRAQRKRDSIVNADYVRRLQRLEAFARARLDSLCHADSLAGKPERCRKRRAAADPDLLRSTAPDSGRNRP